MSETTTTTTSTTPLSPPLPADFEAVLPDPGGSACDEIRKAGEFAALFAKLMRWMFTDGGDLSPEFIAVLCATGCAGNGGGTGGSTSTTTTVGTGSTSTTTTLARLSWSLSRALGNPSDCCISDDGQTMAVTDYGGKIWVSTDGGSTWSGNASNANWSSVCCSSDGTLMYATVAGLNIWTSTDSGATWTNTGTDAAVWSRIRCSKDGTKIYGIGYYVVSLGGTNHYLTKLYASADSGSTWNYKNPEGFEVPNGGARFNLAVSDNGEIVLLSINEKLGLTVDAFSTFGFLSRAADAAFFGLAMAGNGTVLYAIADAFNLLKSTDGGASWTTAGSRSAMYIASASTGSRLVMNASGHKILESFDYGSNIVEEDAARQWRSIACNPDGSKAIAVANSAGVYLGT